MKLVLDSNVILRWADSRSPEHTACAEAITALAGQPNVIYVCAQVIIESYVVATRPVEANGLGFTIAEARQFLTDIEGAFPCLHEPPDMGKHWSALMMRYCVVGRQAHDARIVALMINHGIDKIVTLNPQDFVRYQEITPLTPAQILHQ